MTNLDELFDIKITKDQLSAEIWYNDQHNDLQSQKLTESALDNFLKNNNILFGIINENKDKVLSATSKSAFPIIIARGVDKEDGIDGKIEYKLDLSTEVDRSEGWDFREVMRIPTVKRGERLATIIPPTKGKNGKTVSGKEIPARPGKPAVIRAGKNVVFNDKDQSFYAAEEGQANVKERIINVETVYEIREDISMKTGNIDFVGTVIVHGDVPTGFTIKATGDIKIFGLVEAATIIADGSVFVSEGIAGLKKGIIQAGENVQIGYINQGEVTAGNSIFVENSILHGNCTAQKDIYCQKGNIIGGIARAGQTIGAKDVGNRMNTLTKISFDMGKQLQEELFLLEERKHELTENIKKLQLLRSRLEASPEIGAKQKVTLLKLKSSHVKSNEELYQIEEQIAVINEKLDNIEDAHLQISGTIFPNVNISFGKYERTIMKKQDHVTIRIAKNDIVIIPL